MNSINEIAKYKYEFNNNSPVNLDEYIIIEDKALGEKYLLFKLFNSISENLKKVECQVIVYNENNFIVEDIKFSFSGDFEGNNYFVPENKLKINSNISSIRFNIIYLEFETLKFVDNALVKIPQTMEDFMKKSGVEPVVVKKPNKWTKKLDKLKYKSTKKSVKKDNNRQYVTNVNKSNRTKIHIVWTLIFSIVVVAYFVTSLIIYSSTTRASSDLYCDYIANSSTALTLSNNYNKTVTNYNVPEAINNNKVTKIGESAFKDNKNLRSITLNYYVEIGASAFEGCSSFTTINNPQFITKIDANAFKGTKLNAVDFPTCGGLIGENAFPSTNITEVHLPNATLGANSLKGLTTVQVLEFDKLKDNALTLRQVFGGSVSVKLNKIIVKSEIINDDVLNGFNINNVTLTGDNTSFRSTLLQNQTIYYFKINASDRTLKERTDCSYFARLHVNLGNNNNTKFLSGTKADTLILDKGTLQTDHLINFDGANSLYITNEVNYSYVDFERIIKYGKFTYIYFEGEIPVSLKNYYYNVFSYYPRYQFVIE